MGTYLSKPVTKKESANGTLTISGRACPYGVTSMQGWRVSMEDAHCIQTDFEETTTLLAVFDGHGGKEVAIYCSQHIPEFLKGSRLYQEGDISGGLRDTFMSCDRKLLSEEAIQEMKQTLENEMPTKEETAASSDERDSDDEIDKLVKEADMPIEDVLMNCVGNKQLVENLVNLANKGLEKDESESTSEIEAGGKVKPKKFRVYEKFFHELIMQDGPLSKELEAIIDEEVPSSSSDENEDESDEEEEDESEIDGKENDVGDIGGGDMLSRRKRWREADEGEIIESNSKRVCINKDGNDEFESEGYESGTTAVVCLIKDNQIIVANAGDSRCVLSSDGEAIDLSLDHKPLDPIELERIQKAGGTVDEDLRVDGGLNLSRAIGDHMYKMNKSLPLEDQMISALPDIQIRTITSKDEFLILASDGIWNCKESQEVVQFIRKRLLTYPQELSGFYVATICEELCDSCLAENIDNDGTGCDNMTVIISLLKPLEHFSSLSN